MTDKEFKKKKKQLLLCIRESIKDLETYIDNRDDFSKNKSIVKFKLLLIRLRAFSPYFLSFVCSTCFSFFAFGDIPFFVNDIKRQEHIKKEMDSFGNLSFEQQYERFDNEENIISSYSAWLLSDSGMYEREVTMYFADKFTLEELERIVMNFDVSNLNIIGKKIESRNKVSSDELLVDSYLKYTFYEVSDVFYTIPEAELHNSFLTFVWFLETVTCLFFASYWRSSISDFSYYKSVEEVYRYYLPNGSDIEVMKKILSDRIENYNLLVKKK